MTEPKTETTIDQQFTADMVTDAMCAAYRDAQFRVSGIAAAINASGLPQEIARLRAENEALRKERDQSVQSYAADRERFAAQEERHRVKTTEQAERIRELVEGLEVIRTAAQIAPAIDPDNYDIDQVTELDSAMGKIYNIAKNSLAKHGRAGE